MDFSFSSDQEELRGLTNRVLTDRCTMEHLKEIEDADGVDLPLWRELADLGIVGIGMPEADGGAGLGYAEVAIVLVGSWPNGCSGSGPPSHGYGCTIPR